MKKIMIPCLCGKPSLFEYEETVELNNEVIEQIMKGEFMSTECPHCKKLLKQEFPVRFTDEKKSIDIFFLPEKERDIYMRGKSKFIYKKVDRIVIGYTELIEKLKIIEAELDDIIVESVKYYILSKIENENKIENEVLLYFNSIKDDKLIFEIHGLNKDEIGYLPIERNFYNLNSEKLDENIKNKPFSEILKPPYISLLKVYREYEEMKME